MIARAIPSSGEMVPAVGLGTWQAFDVGSDEAARAPLAETLRLFFAAGGTVIDSSPMYGRAEAVVGDLLTSPGTAVHPFLATKVWTRGRAQGIARMEESGRRLRRDILDLLQVHNLVDWRTQLATLKDWKAAGRVRYIGITHYTESAFDDLAAVMRREPVDFVQLPYSVALPAAEERLLPLAAERGIAVIVNRPFEGGDLFRAVRRRALPDWAADFDCTSWAQVFLKYILAEPAVTCVIPGTGRPEHLRDNMAAGQGRLPDRAQRRRIRQYLDLL